MIGTELTIIEPANSDIGGDVAERLAVVHTNAKTDFELLEVWLKSHADGSAHTQRAYGRIGRRFVGSLELAGTDLKRAKLDDVLTALEAMRTTDGGTEASAATLNTYIAAVKSFLGFAHQVGFTRFNAAPLIKLKRAPRKVAEKLLTAVEVELLIRGARPGRDRLMIQVAYNGALRVSELVGLTWSQVIPRETGEAQLALIGKGDKARHVLLPAELARLLFSIRGGSPANTRIFPITARRFNYIVKSTAKRVGVSPEASAHWLRHAHASHAIDNGAPLSLVSQTLGHADLKTTSVYAHAKPGDSSSRYLRK